jgi:N-methylhydantoinase B
MKLDPITYEVVRHRLWQINDEQGTTIRTLCTSPIVVEGNDFNVGLFTPEGELAVAGPYVLTHVQTMDAVIQNVIKLAENVREGDVYLVNDPYLGALHQNDVAVVGPLHYRGECVLWAGNVIHHTDIGGIDEGGFCVNATSVFHEPPRYFLKVVDQGVFSRDVERTFTLNSRLPDQVALDLRAQVGALHVVKRRLLELIEERGPEVVVEVMRRSVDDAAERLRRRIAELPEGRWSTEVFMDGDRVGSPKIHRVALSLEKRGDELFFDYTGTDPQCEGAVNCTGSASYAGTTTPIYTFLCGNEIDWNSAVRRCVHVHAPEGTVMNARFPAAVSICSIGFTWLAAMAATKVVAQMLSASETYRDRVCPSWGASCNANNIFGFNEQGRRVGALLSDHRGTGAAARSFADGFDHSGMIFSYLSFMADVESQEWKLPLLYLFRRELPDSGGPGKFRGGLSALIALTPYRTESLIWKSQNTAGVELSNASGIDGGYPGAGSQVSVVRQSRVWEQLGRGEIPLTYEDLGGTVEHLPSKSDGRLARGDVFVFYPPGGGGYGDPLDRDPELVRRDVLRGAVTAEGALRFYAVRLTRESAVDGEATGRERAARNAERLGGAPPAGPADRRDPGEAVRRVAEYLVETRMDGRRVLRCRLCRHLLGPAQDEPRRLGLKRERPLAAAGPWLALPWQGESPHFVLVESICPSCGVVFDVEQVLKVSAEAKP